MTALTHFTQCSPGLESLHLTFPSQTDDSGLTIRRLFHDVLPSLRALKYLGLVSPSSPIPFKDIAKLATFPFLTDLIFVRCTVYQPLIVSPQTKDSHLDGSPGNVFGHLKSLFVESPSTLGGCIPFISSFCFPVLDRFTVAASLASDVDEVDALSKLICDNCSHDTLQFVSINSGNGPNGDAGTVGGLVLPVVLQRLFCFRNIVRFQLTSELSISLDDDVLEALTLSWPHLEHLQIASSAPPSRVAPQRATLRGLTHFARNCPRLSALAISVDVRGVDAYLPRAEHRNPSLWSIDFYRSPVAVEDAHRVGAFLYALFPKLTWVEGDSLKPEDRANWSSVLETMIRCKQGHIDVAEVLVSCPRAHRYMMSFDHVSREVRITWPRKLRGFSSLDTFFKRSTRLPPRALMRQ